VTKSEFADSFEQLSISPRGGQGFSLTVQVADGEAETHGAIGEAGEDMEVENRVL
jgi:hypothetical protein